MEEKKIGQLFASLTDGDLERDSHCKEWYSPRTEEEGMKIQKKGILIYGRRFYIKSGGKFFLVFDIQMDEEVSSEASLIRDDEFIDVIFSPKKSKRGRLYATEIKLVTKE